MLQTLAVEFRMQMLVLVNIQDGRPVCITAGACKFCQYFYLIFCNYTERVLKDVFRLKLNVFLLYYLTRNTDLNEKSVFYSVQYGCVSAFYHVTRL
jgi:hypothetical protein